MDRPIKGAGGASWVKQEPDVSTAVDSKPILGALILGVATILPAFLLPRRRSREVLALLLGFIAGGYLGFAARDGRSREAVIESMAMGVFLLLSLLGLWVGPFYLMAGYFAHGLWDMLHHPRFVQTRVPEWYKSFCLIYDWFIGAFIYFWWFMMED